MAGQHGGQNDKCSDISVTTWNILAPVWANPELYPAVSIPFLDPASRRQTIAKRLKEFDSDLVGLEEVEQAELSALVTENPWLDETYYVHFFGNDSVLWSDWCKWTEWAPNGLAVLVRKAKFLNSGRLDQYLTDPKDQKPIRPTGAGNMAAIVELTTIDGAEFLFVVNHLDAESPSLSSRQCIELNGYLEKLLQRPDHPPIVWCGDFNLELNSTGLTYVRHNSKFKNVSSDFTHEDESIGRASSVFGLGGSARLDHIYISPGVQCSDPSVPRTTLPYVLGTMYVHNFALGLGEAPKWKQLLLGVILIALLPFTLVLVAILLWSLRQAAPRSKWALQDWGSDHLPVSAKLRLPIAEFVEKSIRAKNLDIVKVSEV